MSKSQKKTADLLRQFEQSFRGPVSLNPSHFEPNTVYHYTQATGVTGILEQAELWLTNFSFLNDPSELHYGRALVIEALRAECRSHRDGAREFLQTVAKSFKEQAVSEVYVGCLSRCRDDLSQWRAYGTTRGGRYCIGFDLGCIYERTAEVERTSFCKVSYKTEEQRKLIQNVLEKSLAFISQRSLSRCEMHKVAEWAGHRLARLLPQLKDPAYKAEEEWRIIRWVSTADVSEVCFQTTGGDVRPYVRFALEAKNRIPVVELIVLAPSREVQTVKAADMLLRKVRIDNVKAEKSQVPFAG